MKRIRFSVHPLAAAGIFLILFAMPRESGFAAVSSVVLHELGHAAAALLCGKRIRFVRIMPVGIAIGLSPPASYKEEFLIAAAGPYMNLIFAAVATLCFPSPMKEAVIFLSLSLAGLNALPLRTLDGGHMLRAILSPLVGEQAAERFSEALGAVCFVMLFIFAIYLFFYTAVNMALLFFCACLFFRQIVKNR